MRFSFTAILILATASLSISTAAPDPALNLGGLLNIIKAKPKPAVPAPVVPVAPVVPPKVPTPVVPPKTQPAAATTKPADTTSKATPSSSRTSDSSSASASSTDSAEACAYQRSDGKGAAKLKARHDLLQKRAIPATVLCQTQDGKSDAPRDRAPTTYTSAYIQQAMDLGNFYATKCKPAGFGYPKKFGNREGLEMDPACATGQKYEYPLLMAQTKVWGLTSGFQRTFTTDKKPKVNNEMTAVLADAEILNEGERVIFVADITPGKKKPDPPIFCGVTTHRNMADGGVRLC